MADGPRLRCAIYTRKSSEEGLEQSYNSLQAQQDACAAYIASQVHEGWARIPRGYDDGGYSGGNLDRPGLQMLLQDVAGGEIDVVAVYKIDRLTRSLADFSKLADIFERNHVALVAVTQQFNTSNPMGRLTLNILLTFAQFERELIAERLRDKKTASRKRGMWMGGLAPLGYDISNKRLVINCKEAETVRRIFERFLELQSISLLVRELAQAGTVSKRRLSRDGSASGGVKLTWNPVHSILTNPVYRGLVTHNGVTYQGEHASIVDVETFNSVQALLAELKKQSRERRLLGYPFLLKGIIFDGTGERLYTTYTCRHSRKHRYYVSKSLMRRLKDAGSDQVRVSADAIERYVVDRVCKHLHDFAWLSSLGQEHGPPAERRTRLLARDLRSEINKNTGLIQKLVQRVEVSKYLVRLSLNRCWLLQRLGLRLPGEPMKALLIQVKDHHLRCRSPLKMIEVMTDQQGVPDHRLVREVLRAIRWFNALASGSFSSIQALAQYEGCSESLITHRIRLAFLAPDIVEAILEGRQPKDLTQKRLFDAYPLPLCWEEQRKLLTNRVNR